MRIARDILAAKGAAVLCIRPEAGVLEALERMRQHDVGALVVRQGSLPLGLFGEREYARKVLPDGRSAASLRVADVMTIDVPCVTPDESIERCMEIMTTMRARHLPVVEDQRLCGLISIGDVVHAVIAEQRYTIGELHAYITRVR